MTTIREIEQIAEIAKGTISLDQPVEGYDGNDPYSLPLESILPAVEDSFDRYGWEELFHTLPQEQLEILVCLFLGMKPEEIVKVLQYPNIVRFYNVSTKLRRLYREQKDECLGYD